MTTCTQHRLKNELFTQTSCGHLEMTAQVEKFPYCRHCGGKIERVSNDGFRKVNQTRAN